MILALIAMTGCAGDRIPLLAEISLAVSGGPDAGTIDLTTPEVICTEGIVGRGSWGVQYTDPQLGTALGSLQVIVPQAGPDGLAQRFYLGLVYRSFLTGMQHEIETRDGMPRESGAGTVMVKAKDSTASLIISGHTEDGIGISATINCGPVRHLTHPAASAGHAEAGQPEARNSEEDSHR